jgi:hypothetical protein
MDKREQAKEYDAMAASCYMANGDHDGNWIRQGIIAYLLLSL